MFDSHCHLDFDGFGEATDIILDKAAQNGVDKFIVPSLGSCNWHKVYDLTQKFPKIYPAYGIHPWLINYKTDDIDKLVSWLRQHLAVAIGECGLDFLPDKPEKNLQREVFLAQVDMAQKYNLPIIIHSTKAVDEILRLLRNKHPISGVFHSVNCSLQQAKKIIDYGFYIGIGGMLTRPNARKVKELARFAPLDKILLETDSPEQGVYRHQIKSPENILLIAEQLAKIKKIDIDKLKAQCNMNVKTCFRI